MHPNPRAPLDIPDLIEDWIYIPDTCCNHNILYAQFSIFMKYREIWKTQAWLLQTFFFLSSFVIVAIARGFDSGVWKGGVVFLAFTFSLSLSLCVFHLTIKEEIMEPCLLINIIVPNMDGLAMFYIYYVSVWFCFISSDGFICCLLHPVNLGQCPVLNFITMTDYLHYYLREDTEIQGLSGLASLISLRVRGWPEGSCLMVGVRRSQMSFICRDCSSFGNLFHP